MESMRRRDFLLMHVGVPALVSGFVAIVTAIATELVQERLEDRHDLRLTLTRDPTLGMILMSTGEWVPGYAHQVGIRNDGDFPEEDLVVDLRISAPQEPERIRRGVITFERMIIQPPRLVADPELMLEGSSLTQADTAPLSRAFVGKVARMNPGEWLGISFMADRMPNVYIHVRTRQITVRGEWLPERGTGTPSTDDLATVTSQLSTYEAGQATLEAAVGVLLGTPVTPP
jgi:hypothetical protein